MLAALGALFGIFILFLGLCLTVLWVGIAFCYSAPLGWFLIALFLMPTVLKIVRHSS
jgi:hypothetical protein